MDFFFLCPCTEFLSSGNIAFLTLSAVNSADVNQHNPPVKSLSSKIKLVQHASKLRH